MKRFLSRVVPTAVVCIAAFTGCSESNEANLSGTVAPTPPSTPPANSQADMGKQMQNKQNPYSGTGYPGAGKTAPAPATK
jgi:hypothetical protein